MLARARVSTFSLLTLPYATDIYLTISQPVLLGNSESARTESNVDSEKELHARLYVFARVISVGSNPDVSVNRLVPVLNLGGWDEGDSRRPKLTVH